MPSGQQVLDSIYDLPAGDTAVFNVALQVNTGTANNTTLTDSASVYTFTTLTPYSVTSASSNTSVYTFGPVSVTNPGTQSSTEGNTASLSISASDTTSGTHQRRRRRRFVVAQRSRFRQR